MQTSGRMAPPGVTEGACRGTDVLRAHTSRPALTWPQPSGSAHATWTRPERPKRTTTTDRELRHTPATATEGWECSRQKLQAPLLTGLGLQPTPAWAEPRAPASLALWGANAALSGSPWRSPWRDFGSEKLWMREGQGPSPVPWGAESRTAPWLWQLAGVLAPPTSGMAPSWHHLPGLPGCQGVMYPPVHREPA